MENKTTSSPIKGNWKFVGLSLDNAFLELDVVPRVQDNICKTFNMRQKLANHPNNKVGGDFMKSSSLVAPGSMEFPKELLSNGPAVLAICSDFYSGYHQFEVPENTPVKDEPTFQYMGMQLPTKGFKCKMAQEDRSPMIFSSIWHLILLLQWNFDEVKTEFSVGVF